MMICSVFYNLFDWICCFSSKNQYLGGFWRYPRVLVASSEGTSIWEGKCSFLMRHFIFFIGIVKLDFLFQQHLMLHLIFSCLFLVSQSWSVSVVLSDISTLEMPFWVLVMHSSLCNCNSIVFVDRAGSKLIKCWLMYNGILS